MDARVEPAHDEPMTAQIGRSIPRLEARAKVTGRIEYAHNLRLPGMLYGKVFRSTVAHGRIRSIDTSAAAATAAMILILDNKRGSPAIYSYVKENRR